MKRILLGYGVLAFIIIISAVQRMFYYDPGSIRLPYVGIPFVLALLSLPVMLLAGIVYAALRTKKRGIKAFLPLVMTLAAGIIWCTAPAGIYAAETAQQQELREEAVNALKREGIPEPFDGQTKLPGHYANFSAGGKALVQKKAGRVNVFFFDKEGLLADLKGTAYIMDASLVSAYALYKIEGNWYRFAEN